MKLLSFDPSGSFYEGKGTTGWAVFEDGVLDHWGTIKAKDFDCQEEYWGKHCDLIEITSPDLVLIESYKLFEHKAKSQSWSAMETPQLIGYMRMVCFSRNTPVIFQDPAQKTGVNDERLVKLGYFEQKGSRYSCDGVPTIIHERDAIRHGIYYFRYGKGKDHATVHHKGV